MLGEGHRAVEVFAVARHRREVGARLEEALRELPGPVRAEVEEDGRVAGRIEAWVRQHDRLDELVGDPGLIARASRRSRVVRPRSLSPYDHGEGALGPLGALVAVHGVVTADDRSYAGA